MYRPDDEIIDELYFCDTAVTDKISSMWFSRVGNDTNTKFWCDIVQVAREVLRDKDESP